MKPAEPCWVLVVALFFLCCCCGCCVVGWLVLLLEGQAGVVQGKESMNPLLQLLSWFGFGSVWFVVVEC